ncbi:YheC/YheD family protein [Oceanobacillus sp. M60]|uniref:Endospore coat-associated protein YheD n=1 Tax=Oceanobacillus oncorhynchi TaxID=545501 RepID=A0A0A1MM30_9BACI|nr:YheC/YheD family protein [Oceanobacillus oncorhynchi]UUI39532.1 YheC/YheD family protein [Oceanobacillus oncorhynchi]CEI80854.1 Endospore coat-associated protein YheD [Oceanobacillus oncorhynchi]
MLVGLLQPFKEPTDLAKEISIEAQSKGIEILYMNPSDINEDDHIASGLVLKGDTWEDTEMPIPEIIDVSAFCLKSKQKIAYLQDRAYLTEGGRNKISKEKVQKVMEQDEHLQQYAIPTSRCKTFSVIKGYLLKYGEVVVKPIYSQLGEKIYKISQVNKDEFIIGYNKTSQKMNLQETFSYFQNIISKDKFIVQKYIPSRTHFGDPFDCRAHLEKNKEGKWVIAKKYIRVGIGQQVASNIGQNSSMLDTGMFFKLKFEKDAQSINDHINSFALNMAKKIETVRKQKLVTLGLDIGIDDSKRLFLFEANSAPDTSLLQEEVAKLRTDYYTYLLKANVELIPKEIV